MVVPISRRRLAGILAAALLLPAATAPAAERVLTPVVSDTALSAYAGWVVWSESIPAGRWALTAWHDGARRRLPVATRRVPFDADVGPDAHGRPVVTFSRCRREPGGGAGFVPANGIPAWSQAAGCRIVELDPANGRIRRLHPPGTHGQSDTTPSRWHGRLAFARTRDGGHVSRLLLWSPGSGRIRPLRPGDVPGGCGHSSSCTGATRVGTVQQLDLGAEVAAFLWQVQAPAVSGEGPGWELMADTLADGGQELLAGGSSSGLCGATHPGSPNAAGGRVWFDVVVFDCDTPHAYRSLGDAETADVHQAETEPVTWQLARDGGALYELRGPWPAEAVTSNAAPCTGAAAPCRLVVDDHPAEPTEGQDLGTPPFVTR